MFFNKVTSFTGLLFQLAFYLGKCAAYQCCFSFSYLIKEDRSVRMKIKVDHFRNFRSEPGKEGACRGELGGL